MRTSIEQATDELKRIDHLVYVTLKYTRTVDVLLSVIERMINAYEFAVETLLKLAKEQGKIDTIPDLAILQAQKVEEIYASQLIKENMNLFILLRKIRRTNYEKVNEYRRHVAMRAIIDGELVEVNIDSVTEHYHQIKKFVNAVYKMI